ncbi:MAG: hypothetical protein RIA10_14085 [Amphiplicatus sp.]
MSGSAKRPQLMPVVILALTLFALLKANNVLIGFSAADAAQPASADREPAVAEASPPASPESSAEKRLLEQLAERRTLLEERETAIETREQLLKAMERRVEERFTALDAREAEIAALEAERLNQQKEEYAALSSAYERMKARDAAQIFNSLDEEILVPVAAGMRTQALSGVLAEMAPDRARRLTILLADHGKKVAPQAGLPITGQR